MGCRFKDFVYISIILLLGLGVWTSLSKDDVVEDDEWPWGMREVGNADDYHRNVEAAEFEDYDHNNVDDEPGFGIPADNTNEDGFEIQAIITGGDPESLVDDSAVHLPREEDIVHGENHEIESTEDQIVLESNGNSEQQELLLQFQMQGGIQSNVQESDSESPAENPLENIQAGSVLPGSQTGNINADLLAMARQILLNHVQDTEKVEEKAEEQPSDESEPTDGEPTFQVVDEITKPKIVFKPRVKRDVPSEGSAQPKIPRIIHQTWESTEIPLNFAKWVKSWLEKNPGWEYWFWTPQDVRSLVAKDYPKYLSLFESDKLSVYDRANIMRYFIIHAHGGVFAELDMECLNSIDTWIFSHGCFLAEEAREHSYLVNNKLTGNVVNAILACKPHHPFYEVVIHALPDYLTRYQSDPTRASGSFFLDDIFRAFKKHPLPSSLAQYGDVALIEPDYFIPSYDEKHWSEIDKACNTNIGDMPFHVSWLCTLWLRKRMHENQPYEHSYTDHHWIDPADLGMGNIATIPVTTVIESALSGTELPMIPSESEPVGSQVSNILTGANAQQAMQLPQSIYEPMNPQEVPSNMLPNLPQMNSVQLPSDSNSIPDSMLAASSIVQNAANIHENMVPNENMIPQLPSQGQIPVGSQYDTPQSGSSLGNYPNVPVPQIPQQYPQQLPQLPSEQQQLLQLPSQQQQLPQLPSQQQQVPQLPSIPSQQLPQIPSQLPLQQQPLPQQLPLQQPQQLPPQYVNMIPQQGIHAPPPPQIPQGNFP